MNFHVLKKMAAVATVFAAGVAVAGCATGQPAEADDPHIVVTTSVFGDIVSELAGEDVDVSVLILAGSDPHDFAPSPQDIQTLHTADLVVAVGAGFEEALEPHLRAAAQDGVPVLELAEHVDLLTNEALYGDHGTEHHHSEHDGDERDGDEHDHGPVDPHFWHNPLLVDQAVETLANELGAVSGLEMDEIQRNSDAYRDALEALDGDLASMFAHIPEEARVLVTQHHVLGYLADRYGFATGGAIIPSTSTLAQSSASDLNRLVTTIQDAGVRAVFTDVTQSDALAKTVAGELHSSHAFEIVPIYTESLSPADGEATTYLDMMRVNAERIAAALAP